MKTTSSQNIVRVRFAPAPTGSMHLGNVRTALLNFLFARKHQGVFILRIEDTDQERNFDPHATDILHIMQWLGLNHDEGPAFQSQRIGLYQEKLQALQENNQIYRCFCTQQELEHKRERQLALKKPPRYDRTCLHLSPQEIEKKLAENAPFVWRFKMPDHGHLTFNDLARGTLHFELSNFSDYPITRQDGSFTFLFANAIDDMLMNITHVLRGDDHLTNTVNQIALYTVFNHPIPLFWHLPILCNIDGKKLSKRDFGFAVQDLRTAGFLPQAINNYLAIIGGSATEEIMTMEQLITYLPEHPHAPNQIKYDVDKLRWMNHKWIEKLSIDELISLCKPLLVAAYPKAELTNQIITQLVELVRNELVVLTDIINMTQFYFKRPDNTVTIDSEIRALINSNLSLVAKPETFVTTIKKDAQNRNLALSRVLPAIRLLLTGSEKGPHIHDLLRVLGEIESHARLTRSS